MRLCLELTNHLQDHVKFKPTTTSTASDEPPKCLMFYQLGFPDIIVVTFYSAILGRPRPSAT